MDKMIYCQKKIPKDTLRYGLRSSAATGCGWISAYNALRLMGYSPNKTAIVKYFAHQIPVLNGNMGTFILSPAMFFKRFGFTVTVTAKKSRYDEIAKNSDAAILYYWWAKKYKIGAHFVAFHYTEKGFVGYNTYSNSKGPDSYGKSVEQFIKDKKYFGTVLIGICDRRTKGENQQ